MVPRGVAPLWQLHQHGVTCSVSSNNIDNPFTPYGDASLIRRADFIVIDANTPQQVVAGINQPLKGFRAGKQTFERPAPRLLRIDDESAII